MNGNSPEIRGLIAMSGKFYVIIGILSTALAQISLKISSAHDVMRPKWAVWLILSLLAYVVSFLSYYMALKSFDISKVQPIMMASITSIIALYGLAVGEDFNHFRLAGIVLAITSVFLISK
jgi:drug/metabolite transporter (DMT)-like permease